ncbi:hypothetical protein [Sphingomonas sp. R1]|uniref:hypothetical protein n=1 Tax=Sphingomonas sp. R1 TaxID=399176 RepID=UPI002224A080|nr:hypothetical protein [Sphingomonas sp. R1]UYY77196.1 hypothetical protein OIM94_17145 [Sphingomonas sp. R1]
MNFMSHLLELLVLVTSMVGTMFLVARWTRLFTDVLWYFILAPWTVSLAVLLAMIAIGTITRAVANIDLVGPLAFSIQLILLPFTAGPLSNLLTYWSEAAGGHGYKELGWKGYLFASRRLAQREAYAAPRTEQ